MNTKDYKIQLCLDILNSSFASTGIKTGDVFVFNKYQLTYIPKWVYEIISVCTKFEDNYPFLSMVIFDELMNSINERKFKGNGIPSNYIITPNDWVECYEDGYPIIESVDGNLNDLFTEYMKKFDDIINDTSKDDLYQYINWLLLREDRGCMIRCINEILRIG